jgi:diguanylate cyclase (GGDEF)-like protein
LTIWALNLFLHPWIVQYRSYADTASHIWNMQKSLISIGMILVMLEEQISSNEWLALHDELTGLPNRRLFADRLQSAIERCERTRSRMALLILDLNGFKKINDTMGHQAGDQVLREIAGNLKRGIRASDTLARLGGDEFIIVATDAEQDESMEHFVNSVRHAVERPIVAEGKTMIMTASLGVAIYPDDAHDSVRLLRIADQRMYATKHRPAVVPSRAVSGVAGVSGVSGLTASVGETAVVAVASGSAVGLRSM